MSSQLPERPPDPTAHRTTDTPLALPRLRDLGRILARAVRGRCPHCGGSKILTGWATVRPRCDVCGFRYERSDDGYFVGAMFANLLVSEGLFAGGFLTALLITWPDVPWDGIMYGGAALMVLMPALLYPFSKIMWLAIDVSVRPVTAAELGTL